MTVDDRGLVVSLRIGERCTFDPCPRCRCASVGTCHGFDSHRDPLFIWDAPEPSCTCDCHAPWRKINRQPAVKAAA